MPSGVILGFHWILRMIMMGRLKNDLKLFDLSLEVMVSFREIIPFYGRKIQVREILSFSHMTLY